jgi:hypothetical protein
VDVVDQRHGNSPPDQIGTDRSVWTPPRGGKAEPVPSNGGDGVLNQPDAIDVAARILPRFRAEADRLDRVDRYLRNEPDGPYTPRSASNEYKLLAKRSRTNLLPLVINGVAQALYVEGYRRSDGGDQAPAWQWWQANGLDARQSAIHRAALAYGSAYVTVTAGVDDLGVSLPVIRGVSPRRMIAVYDDITGDDWPVYVLRVDPAEVSDRRSLVRLYDDEAVYFLSLDDGAERPDYVETRPHNLGVCPVVRFADVPDLEARAPGEAEPLIPVQDRLNQTVFDLLVAQTFSSFKLRTVSGMAPKLDANGNPVPLAVDARRLLMAKDADTRFGQLDETDLRPLLESADAAIRHLAVISQTPPQDLLGQLANLSAEALAAARDGQTRKRVEVEHVFGESWEQVLRLAAHVAGDAEGARDRAAQVTWRDMEARSLAQVADALGKIATMLGVPVEALWERIPGVTATDLAEWRRLRASDQAGDPMRRLAASVERQAQPVA